MALDHAFDVLVRLVGTGARPSTAALGLSGFLEGVDPRAACCALLPLCEGTFDDKLCCAYNAWASSDDTDAATGAGADAGAAVAPAALPHLLRATFFGGAAVAEALSQAFKLPVRAPPPAAADDGGAGEGREELLWELGGVCRHFNASRVAAMCGAVRRDLGGWRFPPGSRNAARAAARVTLGQLERWARAEPAVGLWKAAVLGLADAAGGAAGGPFAPSSPGKRARAQAARAARAKEGGADGDGGAAVMPSGVGGGGPVVVTKAYELERPVDDGFGGGDGAAVRAMRIPWRKAGAFRVRSSMPSVCRVRDPIVVVPEGGAAGYIRFHLLPCRSPMTARCLLTVEDDDSYDTVETLLVTVHYVDYTGRGGSHEGHAGPRAYRDERVRRSRERAARFVPREGVPRHTDEDESAFYNDSRYDGYDDDDAW